MTKKEKLLALYDALYALYGDCACPLVHDSPFQLLAAVMLSAQCRDERVNEVTKELFALAPDAGSMSRLAPERIETIIHPCGLSEGKSRHLQQAAAMIEERFNGEVPQTMEELTSLPGIGRKSANVVLGNAFGVPGFPVDTHVRRLLNRMGIVHSDDPEKIEKEVTEAVPEKYWTNFSHLIIWHGRRVCHARKAECGTCPLSSQICRSRKEN